MKMGHPQEEIILDEDKGKYDDIIDEQEVDSVRVQLSIRQRTPVERLETQWDNQKNI